MARNQIRAQIRRLYVPNAFYFITGVTKNRRPMFADNANMSLFRATLRSAQEFHPFTMCTYAFLPDHFHLLIFVPETTNVSKLLQSGQRNFTRNYKKAHNSDKSLNLWQWGFCGSLQ